MGLLGAATAVLMLMVSGCAAPQDGASDGDAGDDAAVFVACLKAAGVEAMVGEEGHVLVKQASNAALPGGEVSIGSESLDATNATGAHALFVMGDSQGATWVAAESSAYFAEDPDVQDAYAACETEVPGFAQPEFDPFSDPGMKEFQEQQQEAGLAFARCARDAGYSWVGDPDPDAAGAIELPTGLTEEEFRGALEECYDTETPMGWTTSDELAFDWQAVLAEFGGGAGFAVVEEGE